MKTFSEWIKENKYTETIASVSQKDSEAESLWKANSPLVRLGYLAGFPKAKELNLHNMNWKDLPSNAQDIVKTSMFGRSPFREK